MRSNKSIACWPIWRSMSMRCCVIGFLLSSANGPGPRGHAPLSNSVMAAYLIAFIAAASHLKSVEVAERYGRFRCVAIGAPFRSGRPQSAASSPTRGELAFTILAATLRSMASDVPPYIIKIEATSPPHDQFVMTMLPGGRCSNRRVCTFGPATAIARSLKSSEPSRLFVKRKN